MTTQPVALTQESFSLKQWLTHSSKSRDYIIIFLVTFGVLYFRRPDAFVHAQLWSEEGKNFLWGWETNGIKSLVLPLDQYFLLLPHLIAIFFGLLGVNLLYIPLCYNLSCFFFTFFVATQLWNSASYLKLKHKILYATCIVFVPLGPEVYMKLINITFISYIYIVDFLFVGYLYGNKYLKTVLMFIFSFTGPFALVILPLVAVIAFVDRKKLTAFTITNYAIIAVAGVIAYITTSQVDIRHRATQPINPSFALPPEHLHLLQLVTKNISDIFFLNSRAFSRVPESIMLVVALVLAAGVAFIIFISYRSIAFQRKYVLLLASTLYLASYIAAFWPNESKLTAFGVSRYYIISYVCIAWTLIIAWDQLIKAWHVVLYFAFFFKHAGSLRGTYYEMHWKQQVQEYYEGKRDTFYINEAGKDYSWEFNLPHKQPKQ